MGGGTEKQLQLAMGWRQRDGRHKWRRTIAANAEAAQWEGT
jgi:hypothetical protein